MGGVYFILPVYCESWTYFGTINTPSTRSTRRTSAHSTDRTKYCQYLAVPAVQIPQVLEVQHYSTEYSAVVVNPELLRVWHYPQYTNSKWVLRVLAVYEVSSLGNTFLVYTSRYWEHLWKHSFTDIWSLQWEIEQISFAGGIWSTWSILRTSS